MQKHNNKLKSLRKEKKIKIDYIIEKSNMSMSYYYQLERGEKRLNEDVLNFFADFYGVTTDYLLGRTEGKNNIVLEGDSLPEELKGYVDAISTANKEGISPEGLKDIIEAVKKIRGQK
jgi:transcriptional regulator with XRE-family HTH domain